MLISMMPGLPWKILPFLKEKRGQAGRDRSLIQWSQADVRNVGKYTAWIRVMGGWSQSQLTSGERRGSPWTETRLQELRDTITAVQVPGGTGRMVSAWEQRQLLTDVRMKTARPVLFDAKLSAERVFMQSCHRCCAVEAVIRCLGCVPLEMEFLCATCDMEAHKRNVFYAREAVFQGFLEPIPPTTAVVVNENGQAQFCEQICQLPVPAPRSICECTHDLTITPGKHISVVTINGQYDLCLPRKSCPSCSAEWTPKVKDLLVYQYWPASTSCQTLYKFDVFTSFEHMKVTAPAMSRQAFLKMLEHRSVQAGRAGSICADTFQRSFFEFTFCQYKEEDMCQVHHFECPARSPDMLAVCSDGKHYRFSKSKGTEEPPIYEGLFLAKEEEFATFVDLVRGNMRSANDSAVCSTAKFTAGREMSNRSGAQIDEEGVKVAVCRHGSLTRTEPLPWRNICLSDVSSKRDVKEGKCYLLLYGCYMQVLALP
ncbi:uncharacterized protein LOC123980296 [Micropterus dolomieu]|uniref:uncharacterized protein LOC123980296 n=1 Tax=Micropterus dolomieu TaxID=147949 RepID=UPI001E8EAC5E|nr:uncharacterized protein LOC123980296 [Micropterus dolomieu]XP_045920571.1 uncharacterized protein LOC123980296 [Micropterus dolomieu]XP_045920580.1 uncharacterized protein LOC123980296 [Micropterus dolomieu]XP_045920589.1 uncharacterized protein LOC123980296 [Micropterus dolomieu]XP_045920598.1 uncharacterized protein LOC123980296 [Micropterus dolomieu]